MVRLPNEGATADGLWPAVVDRRLEANLVAVINARASSVDRRHYLDLAEALHPAATLIGMFNVWRHAHPGMHSFFVHREIRAGKRRIRKGSYGNRDLVLVPSPHVVDGGTAVGTERKSDLRSVVPDADEVRPAPADADVRATETRLGAEDTSCPALTREAVADGDAGGLPCDFGRQLTAAATCPTSCHDASPVAVEHLRTLTTCSSDPVVRFTPTLRRCVVRVVFDFVSPDSHGAPTTPWRTARHS